MPDPWEIATWRFEQIAPLINDAIDGAARRAYVRTRTKQSVDWPQTDEQGRPVHRPISRATLYRWRNRFLQGGMEALVPGRRADSGRGRVDRSVVIAYALGLLYEEPDRSLTQLLAFLGLEFEALELSRSTLHRELAGHPAYEGVRRLRKGAERRLRDRYQADRPHELWQLDAKGPFTVKFNGIGRRVHVLSVLDAFKQAEANGMTIYYPSDEEIARWKEASAPTIDAWMAEAGDLGRQLLDAAENF